MKNSKEYILKIECKSNGVLLVPLVQTATRPKEKKEEKKRLFFEVLVTFPPSLLQEDI